MSPAKFHEGIANVRDYAAVASCIDVPAIQTGRANAARTRSATRRKRGSAPSSRSTAARPTTASTTLATSRCGTDIPGRVHRLSGRQRPGPAQPRWPPLPELAVQAHGHQRWELNTLTAGERPPSSDL